MSARRKVKDPLPPPEYVPREGARISKEDAAIVGPEIERIAKTSGGKVSAAALVEEAKAKTSPLHRFFEWNNAKAAEEYRLEQARKLIRSIEIRRVGAPEDRMRAFHIVRAGEGEGYAPIDTVLRNVDMSAELLTRAKNEAASWARRYASLRSATDLAGVFIALERAQIIDPLPMAAE